ncbi:hypothetical protein [Massilia sp. MS-15]|uniref:hypothetical protein n=1 Tax=Massilia sp. MS-15 TaxID=2878200 RepID=UPI001CD4E3A2|nr:hypothetical protein [Massilia sp. MS-15]MCA1246765.1 hypothetical protein [Massilia sp. MS-15]
MESIRMLQVAVYLLALAALGGIVMGWIRFSGGRNPPSSLAMAHGFLAAAGVTLLAYAVFALAAPGTALLALLLFLAGALGGVVLNLHYHLHGKPLPKGIVAAHALISVFAFVLLYMAAFGAG